MARWVARRDRDGRLAFLPLADPRVDEILPGSDPAVREMHSHLVTVDGRDLIKGRAWASILAETRSFRWVGRALLATRMWWVLDPVVWMLSRVRGLLGFTVRTGPGPVRFP